MNGREFIEMIEQDIQTHGDKAILQDIVLAMKMVVDEFPSTIQINHVGKTPEDCYKKMLAHATKNQQTRNFVFSPSATKDFIIKYLGLDKLKLMVEDDVDIDDFI